MFVRAVVDSRIPRANLHISTKAAAIEADVLRIGFDIGFFNKADIARRADRQIAAINEPSLQMIELSMNQDVDPHDISKYLSSISQTDEQWKVAAHIGFIGLLYASQRLTTEKAVRSLWSLVYAPGITDEQRSDIYYLDDAYDLADAGHYGTMAELERDLREFVSSHANNLLLNHPHLFEA